MLHPVVHPLNSPFFWNGKTWQIVGIFRSCGQVYARIVSGEVCSQIQLNELEKLPGV